MKTTFRKFLAAVIAAILCVSLCGCNVNEYDEQELDGILLGDPKDAATVYDEFAYGLNFDIELSSYEKSKDPIQWSKPESVESEDDLVRVSGKFYYNGLNDKSAYTDLTVYASQEMDMAAFLTYYLKGAKASKLDEDGKFYFLPKEDSVVFLRVKNHVNYFVVVKDIEYTEEILSYFKMESPFDKPVLDITNGLN